MELISAFMDLTSSKVDKYYEGNELSLVIENAEVR